MSTGPDWTDLAINLKTFAIWAVSGLIDSVFLSLWVFTQWGFNTFIISSFSLTGIDEWMLSVFHLIFSVSTLAPIVIYVYEDITKMYYQARRRIQNEKTILKLDKANATNKSKRR